MTSRSFFDPCKSVLSVSSAVRFFRVEVVVRGITALELHFPALRRAFLRCWRESADRIHPLDGRYTAHLAVSRMSSHGQQKPWNRMGIKHVGLGRHLAGDLAAVVELPCGPTKMLADGFDLLVE